MIAVIEEGKLICIKTYILGERIENKKGEVYEYYITSDKEGIWVESEDGYSSTLFNYNAINEYFISMAEWRDKQINSILDDN